jgi:O-antigen ligase
MNGPPRPARGIRGWTELPTRLGTALLVAIAGFVLGQQYVSPNKRVLPVLAALLLFGLVWRVDMATGIGVLALALPFPRFTTFGNTNLAFVLLLLIIWLLRVTMRQSEAPTRTPIDAPLTALFVCYVVSFYNVPPGDMGLNLRTFAVMLGCWLMFYIVASNLRTEREFRRALAFQVASALTVCLVALYEVTHPGANMMEVLAAPTRSVTVDTSLATIRVGSVFFDYELLCEYCAINLLLVLFLFVRAGSLLLRLAYGGMLLFLVFVLFTTVTRGGVVSLVLGVLYLMWLTRRRLTFVGVAIAATVAIVGAIAMNTYVAGSTHAGNLFGRLFSSEVKGLVPDTRAEVWPAAWGRIFEHPLIGHGPSYATMNRAMVYYWPHSLYLFVANNVGFIGLAVFLWLLGTLFWMTRPVTDDLRGEDFAASYLLIARAQMLVFLVDEVKIEYLRNTIYQFQVWLVFGLMAAASLSVRARAAPAGATRRPGPRS